MLLGLGMLIDGAIVVTEYADRKMTEGFDNRSAYALAAKRMFWPVTASVATTLAAFLPLMFWPGISGKFMRYLPVTVFTVLSGSLLYALVFGPALGAMFGKAGSRDAKAMETLKQLEDGDPTRLPTLTGLYARVLSLATRYCTVTLGVTIAILIATFIAYGKYGNGMIFFSTAEPKFAQIAVRARGNLSADEINVLVGEVEDEILQVRGIQGSNTYTMIPGAASRRGGFDRIGSIFIELLDEDMRDRTGTEILEEIRSRTASITGVIVEVQKQEQGPHNGKPIEIQFSSHDKRLLEPAVARVYEHLANEVDGLRDIEDTRSMPGIEWKLTVDRAQAALYGADVSQVGVAVQLVTNGVKVGEYRPDKSDDAVDIRVRYPRGSRGINALDELKVSTPQGLVPISNFVHREPGPNVDTIERFNGVPVEYIRTDVAPGVLADTKVKEVQAWLDEQRFDRARVLRDRDDGDELLALRHRAVRRRSVPGQPAPIRPDDRRRPGVAKDGAGPAPDLRPDARAEVGDFDGRVRIDRRRLRQLRARPGGRSGRAGRRLRPRLPAASRVAHLRHRAAAAQDRAAETRLDRAPWPTSPRPPSLPCCRTRFPRPGSSRRRRSICRRLSMPPATMHPKCCAHSGIAPTCASCCSPS
jgi:multidrug efflux pump